MLYFCSLWSCSGSFLFACVPDGSMRTFPSETNWALMGGFWFLDPESLIKAPGLLWCVVTRTMRALFQTCDPGWAHKDFKGAGCVHIYIYIYIYVCTYNDRVYILNPIYLSSSPNTVHRICKFWDSDTVASDLRASPFLISGHDDYIMISVLSQDRIEGSNLLISSHSIRKSQHNLFPTDDWKLPPVDR